MCFVFKTAVVFLCKERLRQKKKLMGVSSKSSSSEVEIIRYQVLIPVTEVQVRASSAKDMDSHFLWELIHLRSQLQRRSEKVYVLSNSTADFRNAFLKTIRQIIRESVRNMSIPATKPGTGPGIILVTGHKTSHSTSHTLERPDRVKTVVTQGSHTLGKKQTNLRVGNFRTRSKTVGDAADPPKKQGHERNDANIKSEGEDDSQTGVVKPKASLGRTPNHLTLSTTSTLSAGSTGSQARLIQSSHAPATFHPMPVQELGSPIWKPRDSSIEPTSTTLPRKARDHNMSRLNASRKSLTETSTGLEIHNSYNQQ
ncbi:hypothetical protein JTB14_030017 [Gonioctena quinquepunctata]|nr:hypothetical protein JTB14_030017 [Gonioctena quinquepunctata]